MRGALRGAYRRLRRRWLVWRLERRDGGERCRYCRCLFSASGRRRRSLDHRVPLCRGGRWRASNLVFACVGCNGRKGEQTEREFLDSEWLALKAALVEREERRLLAAG
jgi:5-methylcytosine-specific restriction endonuclease McrA